MLSHNRNMRHFMYCFHHKKICLHRMKMFYEYSINDQCMWFVTLVVMASYYCYTLDVYNKTISWITTLAIKYIVRTPFCSVLETTTIYACA